MTASSSSTQSPSLSTHDLRSHAIESKREKDHAAKWALTEDLLRAGSAPKDGGFRRPVQPLSAR